MILFSDTSALIKLYIAEAGSEAMMSRASESMVAVSDLSIAESHATFARRLRECLLTEAEHRELIEQLAAEWSGFLRVPLSDSVLARIPALCLRQPIRGGDAVQLASAMQLTDEGIPAVFASSDQRLLEAAHAEGQEIFDPCASG